MTNILNVGARALQANQSALQTAGNNIANVNTEGYSRQSVVLRSIAGQFSGSGYYGKGVEAATVLRMHSDFLTRQATLSNSVSAADTKRLDQLKRLEDIFQGGTIGLGASVSDMLNAFSDIVNAPTDLTARTVVLGRAQEMATRFQSASSRIEDLNQGARNELKDMVVAVNSLAGRIAAVNEEIARAQGTSHSPNDLLDQRDQLIKDLNQYVQTTNIPADDGTVGIFLAGSQALVLGTSVAPVSLVADEFGDPTKTKLAMTRGGTSFVIEEATLGGGQVPAILRFQNNDLVEARNLLGRMAQAIGTAVNDQQSLGVDLDGATGSNLFGLRPLPNGLKASGNLGTATIGVTLQTSPASGATQLAASNYEISFSGPTAGTLTRLSDGQSVTFAGVPIQMDGLNIAINAGAAAAGDRFLIAPFSGSASGISLAFSRPQALAMASPVAASAGPLNQGTLAVGSLTARSNPPPAPVTLTFTTAGTYTRSDTGAISYSYIPGQTIEYNLLTPGASGWSLNLSGAAKPGDTLSIGANAYPRLNAGNAEALLALRDVAMFDGATLTEGYASALASVGVKVQSATYAAEVSKSIANSIESDRAGVAGVNLDEEAAKLLQFQQSYQASAKMIQVAQGVFETLLQSMGR